MKAKDWYLEVINLGRLEYRNKGAQWKTADSHTLALEAERVATRQFDGYKNMDPKHSRMRSIIKRLSEGEVVKNRKRTQEWRVNK